MNGFEIIATAIGAIGALWGLVAWMLDISAKLSSIETLAKLIAADLSDHGNRLEKHDTRLHALECRMPTHTRPSPG